MVLLMSICVTITHTVKVPHVICNWGKQGHRVCMWGSLLVSSRSEDLDRNGRVTIRCTLGELILGICSKVNRMILVSKSLESLRSNLKFRNFRRK
jgi:hypothetical protein